MNRKSPLFLGVSILTFFSVLLFVVIPASAAIRAGSSRSGLYQPEQLICFTVADNEGGIDHMTRVDAETFQEFDIGLTGTYNIEAIAFQPSTRLLFAANGGRIGTLDQTTGTFTPVSSKSVGTGNGVFGAILLNDIDSLTFDPNSGIFYGAHRRDGLDVLFRIDPTSGQLVKGVFAGNDYVPVTATGTFEDIDDIAVDPIGSIMYGIANDGGVGDRLVTIDKATGVSTEVGILGVDDMEGLGFDPTGELIGTTGKDAPDTTMRNRLWHIDKTTGLADKTTATKMTIAFDYEAVDCLVQPQEEPTPTPTVTSTPPTAVHLLYLKANSLPGGIVLVEWSTASEVGTYGFNVYRSQTQDFASAKLLSFLPGKGGNLQATYSFTDQPPSTSVWWYWLEEVETGGGKKLLGRAANRPMFYIPLVLNNARP